MKNTVTAVILSLCLLLGFSACGGGNAAPPPPPVVNAVTAVTVTPGTITLAPGETKQFTAAVTGTGTFTTGVTWSVNNVVGGDVTIGTISNTGLYVAPNTAPASVTITATSTFNTSKSGSAAVTFSVPNVVTGVTVTPGTATLAPGESKQFTAAVTGTGTYTNAVTWSVNNVAGGSTALGTISSTGLYVAPSAVRASVTITATSTFDTSKSGSAVVGFAVPITVTGVTVTPGTATLAPGETKQFTAAVTGTGTYSSAVTWSVNNVAGGSTTLGTVSNTGLYVAPSTTPASVTITATSTFDTSKSGSATVTFSIPNAVTGVTVTPATTTLVPGETKQFTAAVTGTGTYTSGVTWSVNNVVGGSATLGTISTTGLYVTPYPAPASVTIKATSTFTTSKSGSATVTLSAPAVAAGPALLVDAAAQTHAISPMVYGMNNWGMNPASASAARAAARVGVDRWGGNGTTRYNYKADVTNAGNDWYFEVNPNSNTSAPDVSEFNSQVVEDRSNGAKTMGTLPVIGWVGKRSPKHTCSFSVEKYGVQQKVDPYQNAQNPPVCGNGVKPDGTNIINNDPNDACMPIVNETWAGEWVNFLVGKFGTAASGGVAIYSLDNEPTWWDGNHRDVHPLPFTYDEVTQNGLKVAKAVKAADPTAEVAGPVIDFWPAYFYSMKDIKSGWSSGPNWVYNGNPIDRQAHGNVPLLEYYLQQFKAAQDADPQHTRFLDYLDLHTYFVANNAGFNPAGTAAQQQATINSTRVFWDPTYTDPGLTDPDDTSRTPKALAPQMIPRMKKWIADNYPDTKTAITEYNWGAQEHISGAIAQADILGIFGREGLDLGTLWRVPDPTTQKPGLLAFKIFRNYDGANGEFGNMSVTATSGDQGKLSVYAAVRAADNVLTVVVINKTFGDLKADLPLANFTAADKAKVYQYSNADLTTIKQLTDIAVQPPASGSTTSTIKDVTFPAMSITVLAVPKA